MDIDIDDFPIKMVIVHSYVSLPEGRWHDIKSDRDSEGLPWLFKLTMLVHVFSLRATHCYCHVFATHGGSAKSRIFL